MSLRRAYAKPAFFGAAVTLVRYAEHPGRFNLDDLISKGINISYREDGSQGTSIHPCRARWRPTRWRA